MKKRSPYGINDKHALVAIARGELTADPATGHINYRGKPAGAARKDGYIVVSIQDMDGRRRLSIPAHRICWMAWNAPIPEGMVINHRNGMRWDNRFDNLELVTSANNNRHGDRLPYTAIGDEQDDGNVLPRQFFARVQHLANQPHVTVEQVLALKTVEPEPKTYHPYPHRPMGREPAQRRTY